MEKFKKLLFLLSAHERKRAGLLLIMIIMMALLDMIGVASILPFMTVLANPSLIETNFILEKIFQTSSIFGVKTYQDFLFFLGVSVFLLLIFSLIFKAITYYAQVRFAQMKEFTIGKRLVEGYLNQPYSWFLSRNSADLGKNILSEVGQVITLGINPFMELIAQSMVTIALITLLFFANPKLTIIIGLTLGFAYLIIFNFVRRYLSKAGRERLKNNEKRFIAVSEAFGAIKEVKVGGLEKIYSKSFSIPAQLYAKTQAFSIVIAQLPRFILEAIAFGGVLLIVLYMMFQTGSFNSSLPIISLYVFAGYRLLPALQKIYGSFTQLAFVGPSIDKLHNDLKNLKPLNKNQNQDILTFNKEVVLKDISYNYPNASRKALDTINLKIFAKSTVGFIGSTGCGKTTIVDIIMGLLVSKNGSVRVDQEVLTEHNIGTWQRSIGYVPQHIYLKDNSIAANIAFGIDTENIDQKTIEKVSRIANLHEFVINELPKQYQTVIGERGVRLSGGQRQRIGIARALYLNPKLLILDEATSALDNQTEQVVMEAIHNFSKDITIIMIAHRLNTVKNCDMIFQLDKGQLRRKGTFKELINDNSQLRHETNIN